jgi:serine/threonine protein kinase/Flp pilus assembly protein TadD
MNKKPIFGLKPGQLNRLLSVGVEETKSTSSKLEELGGYIGQYRLLNVLGEGGMGVVYLAEQQRPIRRKVAIKVIKPGMDSKQIIARFEAERQALALLDHPNIAHVFEAGTSEDSHPYFVMEYVKGMPITEHCDHHKLTVEDRLKLFLQICNAVHHAHQKGIIHRDIKPSNILVSFQDDQAVPKIIDFGVAKAISQPLTERTLFTEQGQLFGTPEYMSPEQLDLAMQDIDTRSDIYSLGVLLYVLLTSVLPFDFKTFREAGLDEIRRTIREIDPKTPSTMLSSLGEEAKNVAEKRQTEVGSLARCLHKELEWIPLKAMRKERAERYRSVSELADDIENYLAGAPLIAGPPGMLYRLKKFAHRNRALVTGIGAVLAVLVVGVIVSTFFAIGQARARAEADAVLDFLQKNVLSSLNLWDIKGEEITVRSILDAASQGLAGELATEPLVEASIRWTLAKSYTWLGLYEPAELHAKRALEIRQAQLGAQDIATLESFFELGWVYFYQSRYNEAAPLLTQALEGMELTLEEQHGNRLYCMATLGWVYIMQGRLPEAEQLFNRGLATIHRVWSEENQHSPTFLQGLAWAYHTQAHYEKVEPLLKQAMAISLRLLGERHWEMLTLKHNLGCLYWDLGRYNEAEQLLVEALDGRRRVLGEQHSHTLMTMCALGRLYHAQDRYKEAESYLDQAMENSLEIQDGAHFITAECMYERGTLYLSQGQYDEAESLLAKAFEIGRRTMGEENWATLKVMNTLAKLYALQGRDKEAEKTFRRTLEARKNKLGERHPHTLETKNDLGMLYKELKWYDEAETLLFEAVEGRRLKLGDTHPHTLESWNNLIELYEAWNKPEKAKEWRAKLQEAEALNE